MAKGSQGSVLAPHFDGSNIFCTSTESVACDDVGTGCMLAQKTVVFG